MDYLQIVANSNLLLSQITVRLSRMKQAGETIRHNHRTAAVSGHFREGHLIFICWSDRQKEPEMLQFLDNKISSEARKIKCFKEFPPATFADKSVPAP